MAFSSNPAVREFQNGVGFAFRPIQGALDDVAGGVASVAAAIAEIDRLRVDNAALRAENERLTPRTPGSTEIRRENELLTGAAPAPRRLRLRDRRGDGHRPRVVRVPAARRRSTRAPTTGSRSATSSIAAGGALAGRVDRGRAGQRQGRPAHRRRARRSSASSTTNAATGEVVGQLGGVLIMRQIDSADEVVPSATRSSRPASSSAAASARRTRRASSSARSSTSGATPTSVVQTAFLQPAAHLDKLEYLLVITDYEGGLPPIEQQPIDCGDGGDAARGRAALPRRRAPAAAPPAPRKP